MVELVGGGSVINGAHPSSFFFSATKAEYPAVQGESPVACSHRAPLPDAHKMLFGAAVPQTKKSIFCHGHYMQDSMAESIFF